MVEHFPLSVGASCEMGDTTVTRIDAETLQFASEDQLFQLCRGVVKVIRGNDPIVVRGPAGNA